ncbi:nucleotidyl transferase AbiEii/AbiGii toxin family protein [Pontibacter mangrovi]|uniref:Nucleotidyl transferase AbiEii/AbiGii toxin family protein n=1 Tax=Pontibacter mangrovi TaxID=2589816 RepID=A0A501VY97_9BACT|nr:nucleotidyl transferase AbiEii/AbiGii toxin family protein [Pontibacter mangrovi]TPE41060.1 nucleotidyl transferase AbiEii/AbiGii toxin family protein [Pontibacter mangrovi]
MISKESLDISWLIEVSNRHRKADKILVEKVVRALLLLEGLVEADLPFVFKGGTSLMLMMESTKRLSIDIDIILPEKRELAQAFETIVRAKGFTHFELQERSHGSRIEKAHYKFFYAASHKTRQTQEYILLDILFEEPAYKVIKFIPIDSSFVRQVGEPLLVRVPSFEDILGDKLTAFAPDTTGIPYEKNGHSRAMEIIKQLYDIGCLCTFAEDGEVVCSTFNAFAKTELGYRKLEKTPVDVLDDIFGTALTICTRGQSGTGNYAALMSGINQIKHFIFSEPYHVERAITCASKAAYLASAVKAGAKELSKYSGEPMQVKNCIIGEPFDTKLNKLKKSNPEAFFYHFECKTPIPLG